MSGTEPELPSDSVQSSAVGAGLPEPTDTASASPPNVPAELPADTPDALVYLRQAEEPRGWTERGQVELSEEE